ncbi:hypothetical protein STRIP9103_08294 [Streptomyces ipomoeae 91-03]|uniref:Uncharacterized protein n=1 Tax=Streptomyces ipomoeae 91-03 TaxID=698759 RepID=L1KHJ5_9ACTN|nr:hypothetical protein STRIP9103_08294 [Streptomyces ipomoeae 91-03]
MGGGDGQARTAGRPPVRVGTARPGFAVRWRSRAAARQRDYSRSSA